MGITFYHTPRLLLEAEELLYAYTNRLGPAALVKPGPYCIPEADVQAIMDMACGSIPPENETLEFFFQRYPLLQNSAGAHTCLARILAFSFADPSCGDLDSALQSILDRLNQLMQEHFIFEDLHSFTIGFRPHDGTERIPFANGLGRLPAPAPLKEKLLEVFSDPAPYLSKLGDLMRPVTQALGPALKPWVAQAKPLAEAWELQMRTQPLEALLFELLRCKVNWPVTSAEAALLYFAPDRMITGLDKDDVNLYLFVGIGCQVPGSGNSRGFAQWEYQALRLLGSPTRMKMLEALEERAMSSREIAKSLNLHLGTVARDVNSMQEAWLLNTEFQESRRRYSVNYAALRTIANHLLAMCPEETEAGQ